MHNWSGSDLSTRFFSFACNPIEQKRVLKNMISVYSSLVF